MFHLCSVLILTYAQCRNSVLFRYLNADQFVNAIAPKADLTKIGRTQYATLFPVADSSKRGLVSWDAFVVFESILKRADADYWIAFPYFDVCVPYDSSFRDLRYSCQIPDLSHVFNNQIAEIIQVLLLTTSSRTFSTQTLDPMPFLLILNATGLNCILERRTVHMCLVVCFHQITTHYLA